MSSVLGQEVEGQGQGRERPVAETTPVPRPRPLGRAALCAVGSFFVSFPPSTERSLRETEARIDDSGMNVNASGAVLSL